MRFVSAVLRFLSLLALGMHQLGLSSGERRGYLNEQRASPVTSLPGVESRRDEEDPVRSSVIYPGTARLAPTLAT